MTEGSPDLPVPAPRADGAPARGGSGGSAALEHEREARAKGYAALAVVQVAFALFTVFGKWALRDFAPEAIVGWRIVAGSLGLGLAVLAVRGKRALPSWIDLAKLAVLALLGISVNMVLFIEGLQRSTAMNAGLIVPMIPVFTFAVAVLAGHERFCWSRGIGILIALASTMALALERGADVSASTRAGNLLLVASTFCYSLYLVYSRPLVAKYGPLTVIAWVFLLSLWTIPLFASDVAWIPEHVSARGWLSLAYILVFPTIVAYFLNAYALARVLSSTTAVFIFFQSLIVIAAAVLLLHEEPTTRTLVCGAVTFAGTALVLFGPRPKPQSDAMNHPEVPLSEKMRFTVRARTRWSDEDNQQVLNNAVYQTLLEEARFAYFDALGLVVENKFPFLLAQTHLRFLRPGHGGVDVAIEIATLRLGNASLEQAYRVRAAKTGEVWVEARATLVLYDPATGKSRAMPDAFRAAVAAHEGL